MALKLYKNHWWDKLEPYRDSGEMIETGIRCPTDNQELWCLGTQLDLNPGIDKVGNKTMIRRVFAICPNGHMFDV